MKQDSAASQRELRYYLAVAAQIHNMITEHGGREDWRLPPDHVLADMLRVHAGVVRDALLVLEIHGVIEREEHEVRLRPDVPPAHPRPGELDLGPGPFELLEARLAIEPAAAALAANRITNADLSLLRRHLGQMEQAVGQPEAAALADRLFHLALARATGNDLITSTITGLWTMRDDSLCWERLLARCDLLSIRPLWIADHRAVLAALSEHDPDAACLAMSRHIRHVMQQLLGVPTGQGAPG